MQNIVNLKSLSKEEVFSWAKDHDLPKYRAEQLIHWIYERCASELDEITELSKGLRETLKSIAFISNSRIQQRLTSSDGTEKYLFSLEDGHTIESVLIPDKDRLTLCISSQVGCAMGCLFCLTGSCGFIRNLKAYEIIDQIIAVNRAVRPKKVTNVVFMGMGEPLANFDEVVETIWRIVQLLVFQKGGLPYLQPA